MQRTLTDLVAFGDGRVLFPLVATVDQVRASKYGGLDDDSRNRRSVQERVGKVNSWSKCVRGVRHHAHDGPHLPGSFQLLKYSLIVAFSVLRTPEREPGLSVTH